MALVAQSSNRLNDPIANSTGRPGVNSQGKMLSPAVVEKRTDAHALLKDACYC